MLLLKDFKRLDRYLDIENVKQYFDTSFALKISGWFYEFEDNVSSLYLKDNILHFSYNDVDITINPNVCVEISNPTLIDSSLPLKLYEKQFILYEKKNPLVSFKYTIEEFYQITMEEEEDFDWGVFTSNVINAPKKKKQIIEFLKSNYPNN